MNLDLVDSELIPYIESIPSSAHIDWSNIDLVRQQSREKREQLAESLPKIDNVISTDYFVDIENEKIQLRVYRPKNNSQKLPAVFWIHGGGFCFGSVDGDDYLVRSMTREIGCVFVSVDYRLAPEYPYPTPLNDCYAGIEWLFSKADKLSVDSQRIAVGGISAGGGLAAGLALLIRDKGEFNICFQALLCPMIDSRNITDSSYLVTDPRIWNRDSNIIAWQHYMGTTECLTSKAISKYAAPIFANDLHGLPSTYIAVGDVDLFLDEDVNYSNRLEAAGIEIQLEIFKGGFHAFEFLVPSAKISKLARANHSSAISVALFD